MITTEQENRGLSSFRHKKGRAGTPHSLSDVEKLLYNWEEEKRGRVLALKKQMLNASDYNV
jgi:hypothetical protein